MEIEVGEYIRIDTEGILKYKNEEKKFIDNFISKDKQSIEFLGKIVKHSKNIIDLIEERRLCK